MFKMTPTKWHMFRQHFFTVLGMAMAFWLFGCIIVFTGMMLYDIWRRL